MSSTYESVFDAMLGAVAAAATEPDARLVPFWPIRGRAYDGGLLVIGRSVNGWVEDWSARQLGDAMERRRVVDFMRRDAEPHDRCRMAWVTDLAGGRGNDYNTNRSAFWRVLRRIVLADPSTAGEAARWSSRLAWTNLYKVSPAAGWNPGGDLQRAQRNLVRELLRLELAELAPQRVLALTGGWVSPFRDLLAPSFEPRATLVEAIGESHGRAVVVAKHPMAKPESRFVDEVLKAFGELGAPIG